jgi:quercetin dioxygenase-like cupin family protein
MDLKHDRETKPGPEDWFTGEVTLEEIPAAPEPSRLRALRVTFQPGARTRWHHHPIGQLLIVTEGEGRAQTRGGPVQAIRPGDTVTFEAGEEHWHGAAPGASMTHIALQEVDDSGSATVWDGDAVSDDDYEAEPA